MHPTDQNTQSPLIIFGIGNPGEEYAKSRHNLGMMCVQNFAKSHLLKFTILLNIHVTVKESSAIKK